MANNCKLIILDDTECRAILNEAAEHFCRLGTTENFLHILISVAYEKGAEAADIHGDLKIPESKEEYERKRSQN